MEKIKVTPVLLPINGYHKDKGLFYTTNVKKEEILGFQYFGHNPQNLYFVSEEGSKKGEWTIFPDSSNGVINKYNPPIQAQYDYADNGYMNLRVVATTDKSLNLPSIPEQWIENVYIRKQGKVGNVYLEMEYYLLEGMSLAKYRRPKLTKHNEVIILPS